MAKKSQDFCRTIDGLNFWIKLLVFFPAWGGIVGGLYRIFSRKSIVGLILGIVWFVSALGFLGLSFGWFGYLLYIFSVIDFVCVILFQKPTVLVSL